MAPNLLKQVFRNVYRQKSKENMQSIDGRKRLRQSQSMSALGRPQSSHSDLATLHDSDVSSLDTVSEQNTEGDNTLDTITEEAQETKDADDSTAQIAAENFSRLLDEAEAMTMSHLDTIETALVLLQAMESLSPHTAPIKLEMLEKKVGCEKKLEIMEIMREKGPESGAIVNEA